MKLLAITALVAVSTASFAGLITFDESGRFDGEVLSNQYSGVTFAAGNTTGATISPVTSGSFATNTGMSLTTTDIGGGVTSPISGRMLHSFGDWLSENGHPIFTITFAQPISDISIDFGGVASALASSTRILAVTGSNVTSSVAASGSGTFTLSLTGLNTTQVVVTPGDFGDWVGVDNIRYTAVPEPATMAALGIGLLALRRRKTAK